MNELRTRQTGLSHEFPCDSSEDCGGFGSIPLILSSLSILSLALYTYNTFFPFGKNFEGIGVMA